MRAKPVRMWREASAVGGTLAALRGSSVAIAALGACVFLLACRQARVETRLPPLEASTITADTLWQRIAVDSPYETWSAWPGHEGVRAGQAPHGPFHRIFVNAPLLESLPIASKKVPAGGIIVKENMNADARVTAITVMAKVGDFDPGHGDWYWASFGTDGKVTASGSERACFVCHEGMADNDYVIVHRLDAPIKTTK